MGEVGPGLRGFQGPGSAEVGEATGVSAGGDQGSCQGLSHAGLSWRRARAGEGHGWLVQAEGVDLGSLAQGWAPKVSVDETP